MVLKNSSRRGLEFILPEVIRNKSLSVIEVGPFSQATLASETNRFLGTNIEELSSVDTYVLVHPEDVRKIEHLLTGKPFVDPITHRAVLNDSLALQLGLPFDYVLQSMLNPGTSDAEGDTALRQMLLAQGREFSEGDIGFYCKQYLLKGNLTPLQLEKVSAFLANPSLNTRLILSREEYEKGKRLEAPIVLLKPDVIVREYDVTTMFDEELLNLSKTRKLAATLEEMQQFAAMYKDHKFLAERRSKGLSEKATDVELEVWFGLRSEHCFHKELNAQYTIDDKVNDPIFRRAFEKGWLARNEKREYVMERGLFKTCIEEPARIIFDKLNHRGKNWIADMFRDNAGTVYYDEDNMFCIKFETHNSPSNIEPIQGAKTGIDGVNRDIFGNKLGTFETIANFFLYCTGDPRYKGWLPKGVKHPYTLLKGITQGVREGGNESQIPTLGGGMITDPRFIAKILVYCGTVGWSPVRSPEGVSYLEKHPGVGDTLFVAGQPVGRDGIHGATESSLSASAYISLGHVQADFSFMQAKMKEFLLEAARDNLFTSIGDCGAMGISVVLELAKDTNGLEFDLAKHPRKYAGIQPWETACSETQDRMVPVARAENRHEILRRAKLHDVPVTEIGTLTDSGYAHLKWGDRTVALIDLDKLDNKEPRKRMHATWDVDLSQKQRAPEIKGKYSLEESLCLVMSQPDVASKEWFFRQKDSSVKGATLQGPLIGVKQEIEADATMQKPLETEGKDYGAIAYSFGIAPKSSDIDAYHAVQRSFIDMIGKIVALGGALPDMKTPKWDAWAVCGNYCQPNSESRDTLTKESGEHNLASFIREGIGIRDAEEATNIPVISGKDSMKCSCLYEVEDSFTLGDIPPDLRRHIILGEKNGKKHIEIHDPDSYLASCAVKIEDYRKCVSQDFKQGSDLIYVIGTTNNHLGASQLLSAIGYEEDGAPKEGGIVPQANLDKFVRNCGAVHEAIDNELVASSSYIHNGGIATALAKAALAGEKGAKLTTTDVIQLNGMQINGLEFLYSETPGRFLVTVAPKDADSLISILMKYNVQYNLIGEVTEGNQIKTPHEVVDLAKVKAAYQEPLSFGLNDLAGE